MDTPKFDRLSISKNVLNKYMITVPDYGKNPAYMHKDLPDTIFMQYSEKGETFFTMVNKEDYERIKGDYWSGTNKYVTTNMGGATIYLHRLLCPELMDGQFAHHRGNKFDNRRGKVKAVTPKEHDQHRTYHGDLVIDVK